MSKKVNETTPKKTSSRSYLARPEDNAGFIMWQVSMLWQRKLKNGLDKLGITHAQFLLLGALDHLSKEKTVVSQQDLARHIQIDKMMTSKILRTLQKKGLLTRKKNKVDTRLRSLALSEEGQALLGSAVKTVDRIDQDFLFGLGLNALSFQDDLKNLLRNNSK
ncbi:MAG: MarR family winged helix-turn-helix transcriptional regulator [Bacteroidia bacterium]|jgi:DNA-binding MarR family transcriptional regulator